MSNRSIEIARYPMSDNRVCVVTLRYPTFADMPREYTLHAQPTTFEDGMYRYFPADGRRARVQCAPRFNRKTLETLAVSEDVRALAIGMSVSVGAIVS